MPDTLEASTLERFVSRFDTLQPALRPPPDAILERFTRDRYAVIGRPDERAPGAATVAVDDVNVMYLGCESGKGFCSHSHDNWEIFIPMSGRWRVDSTDGSVEIGPWDAMTVPGDLFHSATNISDGRAYMMSINPGKRQPGYTIDPDVLREVAEAKGARER